ncbi:MAG: DUF309 domain-containing protein [Proteobacteria bacterium]|nr:DUF309 domain-containing protein [Pseudomonadota bacterium]
MTEGALFRPTHAYVPGRTPRHPEGTFDALRATARAGDAPDTLARSAAFQAGLHYLDTGFYWEAHEVLEPVWMVLPRCSAERAFVQALIQLANGRLKLGMERPKAALRLALIARDHLGDSLARARVMDQPVASVAQAIDDLERQAEMAL